MTAPDIPDPVVQPEVRWEPVDATLEDGTRWIGGRLVHDGPCVFVNDQCSCGRLDFGVVVVDVRPPQPDPFSDWCEQHQRWHQQHERPRECSHPSCRTLTVHYHGTCEEHR